MRSAAASFLLLAMLSQQCASPKALIIPDEIPTLLSLIYSNIPTLKKGTDSRIGWGFRLGDRADFQVLLELGPQKETQPLANQGDSANKRAAAHSLANALYAQSLRAKDEEERRRQQQHQQRHHQQQEIVSNTKGGDFIKQWAGDFKQAQQQDEGAKPLAAMEGAPAKFTLGIGEVDAKDYIPEDANDPPADPAPVLAMLSAMYGDSSDGARTPSPTVTPVRTASTCTDALDDVDLE